MLADQKPIIASSEARDTAALRLVLARRARRPRPAGRGGAVPGHRPRYRRGALRARDHRAPGARIAGGHDRAAADRRPALDCDPRHHVAGRVLLGKAKSLAAWHDNTRCCGHCGGTTRVKDGGWKTQVLGLRDGVLSAHRPGRDHADHRRRALRARPRGAFPRGHVVGARGLRGTRRGPRARRSPRDAGGGRPRSRR